MAQTIKLKRSSVSGNTPSTSDLELGEVAINTHDGKMFIKKNDGSDSIVEIGGSSGTVTDAFKTIAVSGQTSVVADSATDTLTFVAGTNMTITTNAGGDTITFASTGSSGSSTFLGLSDSPANFTGAAGKYLKVNSSANALEYDTLTFSDIGSTPTTLAGYGITDSLQLGTSATTALAGNTSIPSALTDLSISDGSSGQVLQTDGSGGFSFVNQTGGNSFGTIAVSGQSNVVADQGSDTLTLVAGSNVTITTNAGGDSVTIASSGSGSSAADAIFEEYQFNATGGQTTFTGSDNNSQTLSYTADAIQVFLNGVFLDPAVDYTATNGTSIVLAETVDANDYLQIIAYKKKISDGQTTVDTFSGNGSTTAFTLSLNPGDENNTRVFIDGVYQSKSNYAVSGTTLTFSTAPPNGTAVEVEIGNRVVTLDTTASIDLPDSVPMRFGTSQDLVIKHDGSNSFIQETGTGLLYVDATQLIVRNSAGTEDMAKFVENAAVQLYYDNGQKFATTNTGVTITGAMVATGNIEAPTTLNFTGSGGYVSTTGAYALRLRTNNTEALRLTSGQDAVFAGDITANAISGTSLSIDTLSMNGSSIGASGNMTLDVVGDIILDADGGDIRFSDGGAQFGIIFKSGNDLALFSNISDGDLLFRGNDGGSNFTALTLDMSNAGAARFNGSIIIEKNARVLEIADAAIQWYSAETSDYKSALFRADDYSFKNAGNSVVATISSTGAATFNGNVTAPNLVANTATYSPIVYGGSSNLQLKSNTAEMFAQFINNGAAELYHDSSKKFETFSGGVSVTGQVNATTMHLVDGSTGLQLGNSNDTKFFHDGSNTKITHSGSGGFYIGADTFAIQKGNHSENYLAGFADGTVEIYHDGTKKFETTSAGITITGTISSGAVTSTGASSFTDLAIGGTADSNYDLKVYGLSRFQGVANFVSASNPIQVGGTTIIDASRNLTNIGTISSGAITSTGSGTTSATNSFLAKNSSNTELLKVRDDGVVLINSNYLYVSSTGGAYVQNALRVRGILTNDGGNNLSIGSGGSDIEFNSKNFTSVGTISSGAITSSGTITTSGNFVGAGINSTANYTELGTTTASNLVFKRTNASYIQADGTAGYFIFITNGRSTSYANRAIAITADNDLQVGRNVVAVGSVSATSGNYTTSGTASLADGTNGLRIVREGGDGAGSLGNGITFAQRWWSNSTQNVRTGAIFGKKINGSGGYGGGLAFYSQPASAANMVEALSINSSQQVNIPNGSLMIGATTAPSSRFHVKSASRGSVALRVTDSDTTSDILRSGSQADGDGYLQLRTVGGAGNVLFDASGVSYVTGGNFGIGETNPLSPLVIKRTENTVFNAADTAGQDQYGATLAIQNLSDTNNSFSQLLLRNRNSSKAVSRIASLTNGTGTDLVFVVENQGSNPGEVMRINKEGEVGIGLANNIDARLAISGEMRIHSAAAYITHLNYNNTGTHYISQANSGSTTIRNSSNSLVSVTSGGNISFHQAGAGINFSNAANSHGGATSSVLDDYEEGSYTATPTVQSGTVSIDPSYDQLAYTKIGRNVTINGRIRLSTTSASGYFRIALPFVIANNLPDESDQQFLNCVGYNVGIPTDARQTFAECAPGQQYAVLLYSRDNASWTYWNANNFSSGDIIYLSGTYMTTS